MDTILNFLSQGLALVVGIFVGAFFLIQALICLFFALPLTMRLKRDFAFIGKPPFFRYLVPPIFLGSIFALISWGVHSWFPNLAIAYWVGAGIAVLLGFRQCFGGATNMAEYLSSNGGVLLPEVVEEIRDGTYFK